MSVVGLPESNVLLVGDANSPRIVNNSNRKIVGYTISYDFSDGPSIHQTTLAFLAMRNGKADAGIASGSDRAVTLKGPQIAGANGPGTNVVRAALSAVIFADGEVVGPFGERTWRNVSAEIAAERDLHRLFLAAEIADRPAKAAMWERIGEIALGNVEVPSTETRPTVYKQIMTSRAKELLLVREKQNENAAFALAKRSTVYPNLWRREQ